MKFGTIIADPPWRYDSWSGSDRTRAVRRIYDTQTADWIANLPVQDIAADNAVLMLWATWPKLDAALPAMAAWGFRYKTGIPWVKLSKSMLPRIGMGFYFRGCSELLLIGTRGTPPARRRPTETQESSSIQLRTTLQNQTINMPLQNFFRDHTLNSSRGQTVD